MNNDNHMLEQFQLYLLREGNKQSSIKEHIKLFKRLLRECPTLSLSEFDSFVIRLKEVGRLNKTINHFIITIRHIGKCFQREELIKYPRLKGNNSTFIKATMSDEEIEAFLSLPYEKPVRDFRGREKLHEYRYGMWTVFFSILSYTGARPSEVAHLHIDDIDFGRNIFHFDGKTGKRDTPIPPVIKRLVEEFVRGLAGTQLFLPYMKKEGYMDGADWRYPFYTRLKRLGIKRRNLTTYSLRHSFITRMINEDISLFKVQQIVGHKQIATTAHYVHLSDKVMQETITHDPLAASFKTPFEHMKEILKTVQQLAVKYDDSIYTTIEVSEDGKEMVVRRKIRD